MKLCKPGPLTQDFIVHIEVIDFASVCFPQILQGKKHDKEWLVRKLQSACEEVFQPVDVSNIRIITAPFTPEALDGTDYENFERNLYSIFNILLCWILVYLMLKNWLL